MESTGEIRVENRLDKKMEQLLEKYVWPHYSDEQMKRSIRFEFAKYMSQVKDLRRKLTVSDSWIHHYERQKEEIDGAISELLGSFQTLKLSANKTIQKQQEYTCLVETAKESVRVGLATMFKLNGCAGECDYHCFDPKKFKKRQARPLGSTSVQCQK